MIPLYIRQPYDLLQLKHRAEVIRTLCAGQATSPRKDTELDIMIQAAMPWQSRWALNLILSFMPRFDGDGTLCVVLFILYVHTFFLFPRIYITHIYNVWNYTKPFDSTKTIL